MREFKFNTSKIFKVALIVYAVIFLAGIAFSFIFGVNFDINFRGGTKIAYAYTGEINTEDVEDTVKDAIGKDSSVTKSSSFTGNSKIFEITLAGKDALSDKDREKLKNALEDKFKKQLISSASENADNTESTAATAEESETESTTETATESKKEDASAESEKDTTESKTESKTETASDSKEDASTETENGISPYSETSVNPSIAGTFFVKSLFAVLLTAVLVIIYVGIRFRKIGGVSAAVTALCALILDLLVTFCICVLFRLQIDSNYIAVVLTILGYSLNDTIVVYDRVRENRQLSPDMEIGELVDRSINAVKIRNFVTTLTTFCAVMTIVIVSELCNLTTLRTFAIPMAFGLISGCISSLFVAGPLWVKWRNFSTARKEKKAAKPKKAKKA